MEATSSSPHTFGSALFASLPANSMTLPTYIFVVGESNVLINSISLDHILVEETTDD
jgi:hypothetical protein